MKRILVPADFSEIAVHGLKLAVEVAKKMKMPVEIYVTQFTKHTIGGTFSGNGEIQFETDNEEVLFNIELLQSNRSKLNDLLDSFKERGISLKGQIVDDEPGNGVDIFFEKKQVDMMIMGTPHDESMQAQFTGTSLFNNADISTTGHGDMVLAIDVIEETDLGAGINALSEFARDLHTTIHLVHIADPLFRYAHRLEEHFNAMAKRNQLTDFDVAILKSEDGPLAVVEYAKKINAGMIAVLKNGDHGIFKKFMRHFSGCLTNQESRRDGIYNLYNV